MTKKNLKKGLYYEGRLLTVSCDEFWSSQKTLCVYYQTASTVTLTNNTKGIKVKLLGNVEGKFQLNEKL